MSAPFLISPAGQDPIILETHINSSIERVFQAWTTVEDILKWFGAKPLSSAEVDLRVGGRWAFRYDGEDGSYEMLKGEYVDIRPCERLVFTWTHEAVQPGEALKVTPQSEVTVTFTPTEQGTTIRLVHAAIQRESGRLGVGAGWSASFQGLAAWLKSSEV
ncbi:MAG: SRPBCC domain-containing protein [Gammaproteobacteria bacterium]|nr:SRPBCC domain-containing protein [Gammaproteobacteria bacterium]